MRAEIINYFFEANLLLFLGALIYYSLLKGEYNFHFKRIFVLTCVFISLVIPLVSIQLFSAPVEFTSLTDSITSIMLPEFIVGETVTGTLLIDSFSRFERTALVYGSITLLFFMRFVFRLKSVLSIVWSKKIKKEKTEDYTLIKSQGKYPTFSFFHYLILNQSSIETKKEKDQIIAHELVHIHQFHSLEVVVLELLSVLFWINPVVWFFKKSQTETHEFIADELTVKNYSKQNYQELLVQMTINQIQNMGSYFSSIPTLKRIKMMNTTNKKSHWYKQLGAVLSLVILMSVLACSQDMLGDAVEMTLDIPAESQAVLDKLRDKYPKDKFIYAEIDAPKTQDFSFENSDIDENTIQHVEKLKETNKIGLILASTPGLRQLARLSKDENEVYDIADELPVPGEGNMTDFYKYLAQNMKYPTQARKDGVEGKVFIEFVVDKEGNLTKVKAIKGIGGGCDEEAIRVVSAAKPWAQGKVNGEIVKVRMILPVSFSLGTMEEKDLPKLKEVKI